MSAVEVTPVIPTERLVLRIPSRSDAESLTKLADDFNVAAQTLRIPHPYQPEDAEAFIEGALHLDPAREAVFAIAHRDFGLVGMLGFTPMDQGRPDLGFWIGRPFWNRGYATEALRAALTWAKRDWGKRVVTAGHFVDNPASGQVLCKAGFLYTGEVERRRSHARGREVPTRMMVWLA